MSDVDMFLSAAEIAKLTGKMRRSLQKQVLDAMRIHYRENGIGELVVLRKHVECELSGKDTQASTGGSASPNFASLGA